MDFNSPSNPWLRADPAAGGEMVARLLGFLRPPPGFNEMLKVCVSYSTASLQIANSLLANVSAEQKHCQPSIQWPPDITVDRVSVDFESRKAINLGIYNNHQQSKMELLHYHDKEAPKVRLITY